jgi:hypothetical protein
MKAQKKKEKATTLLFLPWPFFSCGFLFSSFFSFTGPVGGASSALNCENAANLVARFGASASMGDAMPRYRPSEPWSRTTVRRTDTMVTVPRSNWARVWMERERKNKRDSKGETWRDIFLDGRKRKPADLDNIQRIHAENLGNPAKKAIKQTIQRAKKRKKEKGRKKNIPCHATRQDLLLKRKMLRHGNTVVHSEQH